MFPVHAENSPFLLCYLLRWTCYDMLKNNGRGTMEAADTGLPLAKGTAVSAKFKGAFCEATIKDV
jgi:hypothetical protein